MIRLDYEVTPTDFEAFNLHAAGRPRLRAQRRRRAITILVLCPLGLAAIGFFLRDKGSPELVPDMLMRLAVGLVAAAIIILISHLLYRRSLRSAVRTMLGRNPRESFLGQQQLEAGPQGVTIENAYLRSTYRWAGVTGIEETGTHLFIMLGEVSGMIVPKRGQDAAALAALRTMVAASAGTSEVQGAGGQ